MFAPQILPMPEGRSFLAVISVTSLKESMWQGVRKDYPWADAEIKKTLDMCINDYIAKLEEHMRGWFISDIWSHDERCDADVQTAIDEMLKFLKVEEM